ncbi:MAG: DUF4249 domain-containing protein [Bacteroidetes bacterium]|nr:DUF4249 domain-containing protein [Bacteroidota bacterium]
MKNIIKLFILVPFLILTSCTDVIQIKLDEGSKIYVVDAFVNNLRSNQVIKVTTNANYFSNQETPGVSGASVILKDLTANKQYVFNYTSNGKYVFTLTPADTIAKTDHSYELNVTLDGVTYTSFAVQKRTAVIDSILVVQQEGSFGPAAKDTMYNCLLLARDKADNNPDYYWIKTFRNDTLAENPDELNVSIDGTGGIVNDPPSDTIYFTPPGTFLSFKSFHKYDKCKVEVHSVSKETYFFFIQAIAQINNGGLFATTPENVKTNIVTPDGAKTKAIGRFNMAGVATKTTLVQ